MAHIEVTVWRMNTPGTGVWPRSSEACGGNTARVVTATESRTGRRELRSGRRLQPSRKRPLGAPFRYHCQGSSLETHHVERDRPVVGKMGTMQVLGDCHAHLLPHG